MKSTFRLFKLLMRSIPAAKNERQRLRLGKYLWTLPKWQTNQWKSPCAMTSSPTITCLMNWGLWKSTKSTKSTYSDIEKSFQVAEMPFKIWSCNWSNGSALLEGKDRITFWDLCQAIMTYIDMSSKHAIRMDYVFE